MNIAIGARTLHENPGDGIAWFTYEVIRRMVKDHPSDRFYLITDKRYKNLPVEGDNVEYIHRGPRNRHPLIWYFWHQFIVPPVLKRIRADVFIGPDGVIPLGCKVPCIPVIHDLDYFHRPEDIPFFTRNFYRHFFARYACQAARIATVSSYSSKDISTTYDIDETKIDIISNGVSELFSPCSEEEREQTMREVTGGRPFFLFVGNFSPRKNVVTLVRAFERFCRRTGLDYCLVLAGSRLYLNDELGSVIRDSEYRGSVIFTGRVDRTKLRLLYGSSAAFVFVPWFEGFGIPVIEAMRCGTPCIVSDNTSLPEVSGGAALPVSAADTEAIAEAMRRLVSDKSLCHQLTQAGLINVKRYTWDETASAMWRCILKTVNRDA